MRVAMTSYRSRRSGEDDPQAKCVDIGPITIWFSYTTPIAFQVGGKERVVRRNDWGPTTGRHLNEVSRDKDTRVSGEEFERLLSEQVGRYFFPRDLDVNCPAGIVADWLDDRGLSEAAAVVRAELKKVS